MKSYSGIVQLGLRRFIFHFALLCRQRIHRWTAFFIPRPWRCIQEMLMRDEQGVTTPWLWLTQSQPRQIISNLALLLSAVNSDKPGCRKISQLRKQRHLSPCWVCVCRTPSTSEQPCVVAVACSVEARGWMEGSVSGYVCFGSHPSTQKRAPNRNRRCSHYTA